MSKATNLIMVGAGFLSACSGVAAPETDVPDFVQRLVPNIQPQSLEGIGCNFVTKSNDIEVSNEGNVTVNVGSKKNVDLIVFCENDDGFALEIVEGEHTGMVGISGFNSKGEVIFVYTESVSNGFLFSDNVAIHQSIEFESGCMAVQLVFNSLAQMKVVFRIVRKPYAGFYKDWKRD